MHTLNKKQTNKQTKKKKRKKRLSAGRLFESNNITSGESLSLYTSALHKQVTVVMLNYMAPMFGPQLNVTFQSTIAKLHERVIFFLSISSISPNAVNMHFLSIVVESKLDYPPLSANQVHLDTGYRMRYKCGTLALRGVQMARVKSMHYLGVGTVAFHRRHILTIYVYFNCVDTSAVGVAGFCLSDSRVSVGVRHFPLMCMHKRGTLVFIML